MLIGEVEAFNPNRTGEKETWVKAASARFTAGAALLSRFCPSCELEGSL